MTVRNEKRRFTRIPFQARVHIVSAGGNWFGELIDVSLKGILISRPDDWTSEIGTHFLVELHIEGSDINIRMEASVAHLESDHIGFNCEHIDLDSITHLRRLVELNIGSTEILARELSALKK